MKNFKLIAIRPLSSCDKDFTKILKQGIVYTFYNEYDFSKYSDDNRTLVINENSAPDIFSKGRVRINISAIVGENGSGKSSLVELFYVSCYNISVIKKVLFDEKSGRRLGPKDIVPDINVEIFYQVDKSVFLLQLKGKTIQFFKLEQNNFQINTPPFNLNNFFYTISINYSLHSLNSNILGEWVNKVFHKNDGYQTPIVLNPFRIAGNIDINNEEHLVKSRLITNILGKLNKRSKVEDSLRNIIDKKIAYKLKVTLDKKKFEYDKNGDPDFKLTKRYGKTVLPIVYRYYLNDEAFVPENTLLNKYAQEYILKKLISIASKYDPYKRLLRYWYENDIETDDYLQMLSKDKSHVTFKLNQAINFLTNESYYRRRESFDLSVSQLSRELTGFKDSINKELIDVLPPAFFDVDIEFKNSDLFSHLSSGEKQRVYSLATLIYHLVNLNSANEKYVNYKYKRVNIIFDELELYFHPELQRNLINDIIENLTKINLEDIDAINILLITHSPFILSDIPDSNILFLTDDGKPFTKVDEVKTFGGNIHELLKNSFFLKSGYIGEFAKTKIQSIIDSINENRKPSLDEIRIIGEPFIKTKLLEMYYSKFGSRQNRIEELKAEIKRLEDHD